MQGRPDRLPLALFLLRVSVFLVMLVWTVDKFVQPEHAARVYENFYLLRGVGPSALAVVGFAELVLILSFVAGLGRRFTYAAVLALHAISTLSSFRQYLDPFQNLLFFAAWPMLAACATLYLLRDEDTFGVVAAQARSTRAD